MCDANVPREKCVWRHEPERHFRCLVVVIPELKKTKMQDRQCLIIESKKLQSHPPPLSRCMCLQRPPRSNMLQLLAGLAPTRTHKIVPTWWRTVSVWLIMPSVWLSCRWWLLGKTWEPRIGGWTPPCGWCWGTSLRSTSPSWACPRSTSPSARTLEEAIVARCAQPSTTGSKAQSSSPSALREF